MSTPIHPVTGLSAIGWRKARTGEDGEQPIWPILGGSEEADGAESGETEAEAEDGTGEGEADPEGTEQLGDAGKRALDAMKAQLKAEKERRKAAESELTGFKTAKPADGTDAAALRSEALATARAETLRERAMDRLEAKAARLFADPEDARVLLAGRVEDFVDGDGIDADAIGEALTELLTRKPHLAATATPAKPAFAGTGDGGARKGPDGVKQLGKSDLKTMSAEEIVAAQNKGQFRDFLAAE